MAIQLTHIPTDESLRETTSHGTSAFPFEYYVDDILQFKSGSVEWHWHAEFEWIFVKAGTVDCCIGSERHHLLPGDGMFINSRMIHHFESDSGGIMPNILFLPSFLAPQDSLIYQECIAPVLQSGRACLLLPGGERRAQPLLAFLQHIFELADTLPKDPMAIQIAVAQLWHHFYTEYADYFTKEENPKDMMLQARTRKMLQFIQTNYANKITLEQIAQSASVSRSEALRCFHAAMQRTPVEYLIDYRLAKARQLLLTTDDNVCDIALEVGIENVSYFVRIFKKRYGVTPGACRRDDASFSDFAMRALPLPSVNACI